MYGKFLMDTAGYEIHTLNLPTSWEYIYENKDILLKVDQYGPVYAQANPPGDIMLFKREKEQKYSPWMIHIGMESGEKITNFFRPNLMEAGAEPEELKITYRPECASYYFVYGGVAFTTEIFIPNKGTTIIYKFRAKNLGDEKTKLQLDARLVPYLNDAVIAPWDKYEWYLDTECQQEQTLCYTTKLLSADACAEKRRKAIFETDFTDVTGYELSLEKYIGQGDVSFPEKVYTGSERIYAYPPVYATGYEWELQAGEERELTQVFSLEEKELCEAFFAPAYYEQRKEERRQIFEQLFEKNRIQTTDTQFDYYANYWIPLQMNWVASLDRGWPTGMRGSRDSAQDYAALLYTDTASCRNVLLTMSECQRRDGWFPRQYSAKGRLGKHDLRGHVDGGAFYIEFVWKYLAHTGDYEVLNEQIPWLDCEEKSPLLAHLISATEYYIKEENMGEHGLCKIREGDWLDAVNRAGMEGRGESVTVSAQLVMGLHYLADILQKVNPQTDVSHYLQAAEALKKSINEVAWNSQGFYNGTFNDNGQWIFSEKDPDGQRRVYGVANYYAIVSGVAEKEKYTSILNATENLKCDKGYRLFSPCLGETPIDKVGRIASGDVPPYMGENGNVYNHGSQGFFARALAAMGESERLYEMLKWIMPYDMEKHPTEKAMTPPYAIVNCYQQLPGFDHRGLMCFLTGSVAMAMRGVYEWFAGIRPCLDGVEFVPRIPKAMGTCKVKFELREKTYFMEIRDKKLYLNGKPMQRMRKTAFTDEEVFFVTYKELENY